MHWKPNQLKFCIKIVVLSPNKLTVVKKKVGLGGGGGAQFCMGNVHVLMGRISKAVIVVETPNDFANLNRSFTD